MKLYRMFAQYSSGAGLSLTDPLSYTASVQEVGGAVIETPTPVKHSTGWYYVTLTDALYESTKEYDLTGTFELSAGVGQSFSQRFQPAAGGSGSGSGVLFAVRRGDPHAGPREV